MVTNFYVPVPSNLPTSAPTFPHLTLSVLGLLFEFSICFYVSDSPWSSYIPLLFSQSLSSLILSSSLPLKPAPIHSPPRFKFDCFFLLSSLAASRRTNRAQEPICSQFQCNGGYSEDQFLGKGLLSPAALDWYVLSADEIFYSENFYWVCANDNFQRLITQLNEGEFSWGQ